MTCVSNLKLRDLVALVQANLQPEDIGAVNALNGTATNLELKGNVTLDNQAVDSLCQYMEECLVGGVADDQIATDKTWSSYKIRNEIATAINALINNADQDEDTLKELADKIRNIGALSTQDRQRLDTLADKVDDMAELSGSYVTQDQLSDSQIGFATKDELNKAIRDLVNGADADEDTLKELADKILALAQADNGLVSATESQSFKDENKEIARTNIDAVSTSDLNKLAEDVASTYSTKEELGAAIDSIPDPDLTPYATKSEVESKYATKAELPNLDPYATKAELTDEIAKKADAPSEGEQYALASQLPDVSGLASKEELTKAITDLINGADADADTLKELADKIIALAQADNGLVSALQPQSFNDSQKKQGRDNIDAAAKSDIPDVSGLATKDELPDISGLATKDELLTRDQVMQIIKEYKPEKGLDIMYSGSGWYKAVDTGIVYNKDVPEGETHTFEGDPKEYISVYTKEDAVQYAERAATSNMTDMRGLFQRNSEFNEDISHWDTSSVTDMREMFKGTMFNQPLNNWDVSNVTTMSKMFLESSFNQDISSWNVSNVTDMSFMFQLSSFDQPLNDWDVSNVTDMSFMFNQCAEFNQPLDKWNTSSVSKMNAMFYRTGLFNQDISSWDVSNVTDMSFMFSETKLFNQDISSWDVSNVTNMSSMFREVQSFNQDISSWDVSNVTNMNFMFQNAQSFNQDISSWDVSNVTGMLNMFEEAVVFNNDLSKWCVSNIKEKPVSFDRYTPAWTLPKPVWGTCPRGEDQS